MRIAGFIYCVTNTLNGKQYIGCTSSRGGVSRRWRGHLCQARKGSKALLHRAIRKYGVSAFYVEGLLCVLGTRADLLREETVKITEFCTLAPKGYNLPLCGAGGPNWGDADFAARHKRAVRAATVSNSQWAAQNRELLQKLNADGQYHQRAAQSLARRWKEDSEFRQMQLSVLNRMHMSAEWQVAYAKGLAKRTTIKAACDDMLSDEERDLRRNQRERVRRSKAKKAALARGGTWEPKARVNRGDALLSPHELAAKQESRERYKKYYWDRKNGVTRSRKERDAALSPDELRERVKLRDRCKEAYLRRKEKMNAAI